ncbi:MAG: hypothetical protein J6L68_01615 [Muribaculaceae bacterium]|nr:hypothetical protein [Muribaculaceae bacterium]
MKVFFTATREQKEKLMKAFGCKDRIVRGALANDASNGRSALAERIRKAAREMGCQPQVVAGEMECVFTSDSIMHQMFPNGAKLEMDMATGEGRVIFRGRTVLRREHVKVSQIMGLQDYAKGL